MTIGPTCTPRASVHDRSMTAFHVDTLRLLTGAEQAEQGHLMLVVIALGGNALPVEGSPWTPPFNVRT